MSNNNRAPYAPKNTAINKVEKRLCQLLLATIVILVTMQVLLRACFNYVFDWNEELSRFVFVWFVYFATSYATIKGQHIRVTAQLKFLSVNKQIVFLAITDIAWLIFNGIIIYESIKLIISMSEFSYTSPTLGISVAYVYWIFPIAFSINCIRIIQFNYGQLKSITKA